MTLKQNKRLAELALMLGNKTDLRNTQELLAIVNGIRDENDRLKKIIARAPNENDDLGAEYTHVRILQDELRALKAKMVILTSVAGEFLYHIDDYGCIPEDSVVGSIERDKLMLTLKGVEGEAEETLDTGIYKHSSGHWLVPHREEDPMPTHNATLIIWGKK